MGKDDEGRWHGVTPATPWQRRSGTAVNRPVSRKVDESKPLRAARPTGRRIQRGVYDSGHDSAVDYKADIKRLVWANPTITADEIRRQLPRDFEMTDIAINYIKREFRHSVKVLRSLGDI